MMDLFSMRVVIRSEDGAAQELLVDSATATVGSGAHCEIRLPPEDAAPEQLALRADAGGVFAEVRAAHPAVLSGGRIFQGGHLTPDTALEIGRMRLTVAVVESGLSPKASKRSRESASPVVYVMAAVGFPFGFYMLFFMKPPEHGLPPSVPPPALFPEKQRSECRESDPRAAAVLADRDLLEARSARERAPFSPEDGIAAVSLFESAAACELSAGSPVAADEAASAARTLKTRMGDEFHVHQVRLERALATRRYEDARTEVRILLAFVGRQSGSYPRWLSDLDRQLELKFAGRKTQ